MTGLYIHVPFCVKKCHYCDFYSEEFIRTRETKDITDISNNPKALSKFSDFLCREIEIYTTVHNVASKISTIFFGGGTPSLLSSHHLERILDCIKKNFSLEDNLEVTLESNPGTTTSEKLKEYRQLGINRLSFGVQSFIQGELDFLQRIHSADDTSNAIRNARKAGFDNINIDLMFSVPGQTKSTFDYSLDEALKLKPEHISAYSLIYEPDTPLYEDLKKGLVKKVSDERDADIYIHTIERLEAEGYIQYEVSNFARNDSLKCKHNLNYWQGNEYHAFGPSAHGYLMGRRFWNYRNLGKYYELIASGILPMEDSETLTEQDKLVEFVFLGLRAEGISLNTVEQRFGVAVRLAIENAARKYILSNHILLHDDILKMSKKGYVVCDELILKILQEID